MLISIALAGCAGANRRGAKTPEETNPKNEDDFLERYALTRRFSAGQPTAIKIVANGDAVFFLRSGPRTFVQDLYVFDPKSGEEKLLLTADQILQGGKEELSVEEKARRERMRMASKGIVSYQLSRDGTRILVPLSGRLFVIERNGGGVRELPGGDGFPIDPKFSPDGRYVSCVRNNEVFVTYLESMEQKKVTSGAGGTITNGLAEFVAQEEMDRFEGYWWSPDSTRIAYQQTDTAGMEVMNIMDAMHPERPPSTWPYPRAGMANAKVKLGVVPVSVGETSWVDWGADRFPYLNTVKWKENAPLTILVMNREQTQEQLMEVDPASGKVQMLLTETDAAWLNLDQQMPFWSPDGSNFLWTTERNGATQVELHDRAGRLKGAINSPEFALKRVAGVDFEHRILYAIGGDDPAQSHLFRFSLDGGASPVRMTEAAGIHGATLSENGEILVLSSSTLSGERTQVIRNRSGAKLGQLKSVAETPPFLPKLEYTMTQSEPPMHAVLVRPRNFHKSRKYPVIVSVYAGPHAQTAMAAPYMYLLQQWMADRGFIVVSIDGRGTPSRGRDWERAIKNDLIKIPLQDQVAGLQALGRQYPELDMSRVGIEGWSFGGYFSAMATMQRPDVYRAGIAGAPVCDWRDYDTFYTERYMDLPDANKAGYDAASVLAYCDKLERPLLIIHGTADDNVYFMHSLKMSNALFRAGKPHQFLALSDFTHMVADPLITTRLNAKIMDFFEANLR
ncbi:MAG: DPP IV N-terminal domain-containing protein [Planctomycetes bacterium]|nr:DPP IV N-terminal domain-containing protein [Planctomycetota bacterium]MBI3832879.1 DPP IV N-terminal domain-containing protein [Planctomycetota bacterium]